MQAFVYFTESKIPRKLTLKSKMNRQAWSQKFMEEGVKKFISGTMGFIKAAKHFTIPKN